MTTDAVFHRELSFPRQDIPGTHIAVAFFTFNLGVKMRFVAEQDKIGNRVDPNPGDRIALLGVFRYSLHLRAARLDGLVTHHAVSRRGNLLELALGVGFMAGVTSQAGVAVYLMAERNRLLNGFRTLNLPFRPLTVQQS